jgi:hypothetical protein
MTLRTNGVVVKVVVSVKVGVDDVSVVEGVEVSDTLVDVVEVNVSVVEVIVFVAEEVVTVADVVVSARASHVSWPPGHAKRPLLLLTCMGTQTLVTRCLQAPSPKLQSWHSIIMVPVGVVVPDEVRVVDVPVVVTVVVTVVVGT